MSNETISNPATSERSAATSKTSPGSAQASPAAQAPRGAEVDPGRIAMRAYELYEEGGRQEGQAVEDWLNAERQLVGAAGKP